MEQNFIKKPRKETNPYAAPLIKLLFEEITLSS